MKHSYYYTYTGVSQGNNFYGCINCVCMKICSIHKTCEEGVKERLQHTGTTAATEFHKDLSLGKRKQLIKEVEKDIITDKLIR